VLLEQIRFIVEEAKMTSTVFSAGQEKDQGGKMR